MATVNIPHVVQKSGQVPQLPTRAWTITPENDDAFDNPVTIYVDVAGDVVVIPFDPHPVTGALTAITFNDVAAGTYLPVRVRTVQEGTSATVYGIA